MGRHKVFREGEKACFYRGCDSRYSRLFVNEKGYHIVRSLQGVMLCALPPQRTKHLTKQVARVFLHALDSSYDYCFYDETKEFHCLRCGGSENCRRCYLKDIRLSQKVSESEVVGKEIQG